MKDITEIRVDGEHIVVSARFRDGFNNYIDYVRKISVNMKEKIVYIKLERNQKYIQKMFNFNHIEITKKYE